KRSRTERSRVDSGDPEPVAPWGPRAPGTRRSSSSRAIGSSRSPGDSGTTHPREVPKPNGGSSRGKERACPSSRGRIGGASRSQSGREKRPALCPDLPSHEDRGREPTLISGDGGIRVPCRKSPFPPTSPRSDRSPGGVKLGDLVFVAGQGPLGPD